MGVSTTQLRYMYVCGSSYAFRRGEAIGITISIPLPQPCQYQCQQVSVFPKIGGSGDRGSRISAMRCEIFPIRSRVSRNATATICRRRSLTHTPGLGKNGMDGDLGVLWRLNHCYLEPLGPELRLLVFSISGNFVDNSGPP